MDKIVYLVIQGLLIRFRARNTYVCRKMRTNTALFSGITRYDLVSTPEETASLQGVDSFGYSAQHARETLLPFLQEQQQRGGEKPAKAVFRVQDQQCRRRRGGTGNQREDARPQDVSFFITPGGKFVNPKTIPSLTHESENVIPLMIGDTEAMARFRTGWNTPSTIWAIHGRIFRTPNPPSAIRTWRKR